MLKPGVYQSFDGVRKTISGSYLVSRIGRPGNRKPIYRISFRLASYDKRRPLIIDPVVTYNYASYLGGSLIDIGDAVAVDPASGHLYVSGQTDSPDFPISARAYQNLCKGCFLTGAPSAFVAEINPKVAPGQGASSLIYATYLGGSGNGRGVGDEAFAVAIDAKGNAYVGGYTFSSDFPLVNAFQNTCKACGGLGGDAFASELNYNGSELLYSTYLGSGAGPVTNDAVLGIGVDPSGNINVGGIAVSSDFPTTADALQPEPLSSPETGFFSILNPSVPASSQLIYSTYLGGSGYVGGTGGAGVGGVAIGASGDAYVSGAAAPGLPTLNAYQSTCATDGTPTSTAFAAEFKAITHRLAYSTYLCGGRANPNGLPTVAVDGAGDIYLSGSADSTLPTTPNAPQAKEPSGPKIDNSAFAAELNPSRGGAAQLVFSTFLGGSGGASFGRAIAYGGGQIYVTGGATPNFLISHNATQKTCGDPSCGDAFITVLNPAASTASGALVFSSYFGGNGSETGAGIGVDGAGNFTAVGASSSSNLPTTSNALKATCPTCGSASRIGGFNAWIASYRVGPPSLVEGFIYDVALNFPNRTSVDLNLPLAGATVQLLDSAGAVVAEDTTDATGYYELDTIAPPGIYTVEVTKNANLYDSSTNSYLPGTVEQVRSVTVTGTAPVALSLNLPVSIVNEAASNEYALHNLPDFAGLISTGENYDTSAIEAHIKDILSANPPPDFIGVFNGGYPRDDWNSLIRIDVAMETLGERASDAVLLANDLSKALGQWIVLRIIKGLAKDLFETTTSTTKSLNKSILTAAANALKADLDFGVYFVIKPLLTKFNVSAADQAKITELYIKLFKLGIDTFLGKLKPEAIYQAIYQALRLELFEIFVHDFITSTQPVLDTAAIQFSHNAIRDDTNTTLVTIEVYDAQLSNFAKYMDGITMTALADISAVTGTVATSGAFGELQSLLFQAQPLSKFSLYFGEIMDFLKEPADRAVDAAYATGSIAPIIGETLSIDPASAVVTAAMIGADSLPPVPSAIKSMKNGVTPGHDPSLIIGPPMAVTPVPTSRPTATPIPLPAPVQEYLDELGKLSKILAANDLASYNAETANLTAANDVLFNYLTPIGQRASAAMPQLPGNAATDAISLASEYDAASDDIGLSYLALQLWAAAQDTNSLAIAASLVTDTIAAVTAAGQQAVLVQNDLKGVTVPGQIVIAGDGVPVGGATFGGTVNVNYSFTNVGDKALPAGSVTLLPNANLALLTEATVTLPALAPGGSFLAGWQFNVSGSTSPVDFGHYQIDSSVTGAQPISLDEIFVIAGVPAPTPTLATTSTPARSATPKPTSSPTGSVTPARSVTPKPTPTPSSAVSATPSARPTPPPLGSTTADRVLGQHYLNTYYSNLIDGHSMNHPQRVAIDRSVTPNRIYVSDTYYNRVLGWHDAQNYKSGDPADLIIGQPDAFSIGVLAINIIDCPKVSGSSLCQPEGVAVDGAGNLYVADTGDDRVLKYNTPFQKTAVAGSGDTVADMIFGLSSFTVSPSPPIDTVLCNGGSILTPPGAATLCEPSDVAVDVKGDVFISDSGNCRVVEYNTPAGNDPSANLVFGQGGFTTKTCNNGNKTVTRGSFGGPTAVALDGAGDLYVTDGFNNRVMEYFKPLTPPGAGGVGDTAPDLVFGQPNFTTASCGTGLNGLCFDNGPSSLQPGSGGIGVDGSGNLYVADTFNNRVVEYNAPLANQPTADLVFGGTCEPAPNVTVIPPYAEVSASTLCYPGGVAFDLQNDLFVADTGEGLETTAGLQGNQGRIVEYVEPKAAPNPATGAGDTIADRVLGQIDLSKAGPNMVKASGLLQAEGRAGIAVDTSVFPNHIYVSDANNRVLGWHDAQGFKNGDPADLVLGQPDFYSYLCNNGGVSANSLCQPAGLALDSAGNLYVADYLNHRVLEYNTPFTKTAVAGSGDTTADVVFGQSARLPPIAAAAVPADCVIPSALRRTVPATCISRMRTTAGCWNITPRLA